MEQTRWEDAAGAVGTTPPGGLFGERGLRARATPVFPR
jgi:hypothetical protein